VPRRTGVPTAQQEKAGSAKGLWNGSEFRFLRRGATRLEDGLCLGASGASAGRGGRARRRPAKTASLNAEVAEGLPSDAQRGQDVRISKKTIGYAALKRKAASCPPDQWSSSLVGSSDCSKKKTRMILGSG